ncbi:MAG: twin-arginine translocase subunit TatC [Trueperaceae bacterium]
MTLLDHLEELRWRILVAVIAWLIAASVVFYFRLDVIEFLRVPLPNDIKLNFFNISEPFTVAIQIAGFFGFILASPIILSQVWGFIAPGLYKEEKRWAIPFVLLASIAFASGAVFTYYVLWPMILPIMLGFFGDQAAPVLTIGKYISDILGLMAILGLIFEMPVLGFLLAKIGLVRHTMLISIRRYAIIASIILAALITPTGDPFTLGLVAVPLVLLYELTVIVVRLAQRRIVSEDLNSAEGA